MKTMLTLVCVLTLSLSGCKSCTKPTCDQTAKYSATAGARVADFLECKNPDAIAADLAGTVEKLNLCTNPVEQGAVAAIVCRPVAMLVAQMAINGLPSKWECTGGAGGKAIESAVYAACAILPY